MSTLVACGLEIYTILRPTWYTWAFILLPIVGILFEVFGFYYTEKAKNRNASNHW